MQQLTIERFSIAAAFSLLLMTAPSAAGAGGPSLVWQQVQVLEGSAADDWFGYSVAASDDTLMIGAPYDNRVIQNAGAVYVYEPTPSGWVEVDVLTVPDAFFGEQFGNEVEIDGDRAVISAIQDDDAGLNTGAVYVFERIGGVWTEVQKIVREGLGNTSWFGQNLALKDDVLVVTHASNHASSTDPKVYVYRRGVDGFELEQELDPDATAPFHFAGGLITIEGDTIVIGGRTLGLGDNLAPHIFTHSAGVWTFDEKLEYPNAPDEDFGGSVVLDGDMIAATHIDRQEVVIFRRTGLIWESAEIIPAAFPNPCFGCYDLVTASGRIVASAGIMPNSNSVHSVSTYVDSGSGFVEEQRLNLIGSSGDDLYGFATALNANALFVGAPKTSVDGDSDRGVVAVYTLAPGPVRLFADGFESGDQSAWPDATP